MTYPVEKTCKDCKNIDTFFFEKIEAAFGLYGSKNFYEIPCSKCNSLNTLMVTYQYPEVDTELLDLWGNNLDLFFSPDDEDILLADIRYLPVILKAIDESKYFPKKINILIASLCILLYDNITTEEDFSEEDNEKRENIAKVVLPELRKRKKLVMESESIIMDYIKTVVFPKIFV